MLTYCLIQWNGYEQYNYILVLAEKKKCTLYSTCTMRIRKNNHGTSSIKLAFELIINAD